MRYEQKSADMVDPDVPSAGCKDLASSREWMTARYDGAQSALQISEVRANVELTFSNARRTMDARPHISTR